MAERGGAGQGRSNADPLRAALNLNSDQQRDRRGETEDILGGDSSMSDIGSRSVLDTGSVQPSYAFREPEIEPPMAGGGHLESPALELDRQRAREQQMRNTQEQFVGGTNENAPQTRGEETRAQAERPQQATSPQESSAAEDEEGRAAAFEAGQQAERERAQRQGLLDTASRAAEQVHKESNQKLLDYIKMGNAGLSVESLGATLVLNQIIWVIQVLNKYFFKNGAIPEPRREEEWCCVGCSLSYLLTCPFQPPCYWGCILIFFASTILLLLPAIDLVKRAT